MRCSRKYTECLVRHYADLAGDPTRPCSLLGREVFRHETSVGLSASEGAAIFVIDMGRCLDALPAGSRLLVERIAVAGLTMGEVAARWGWSLRSVVASYGQALDQLTILLVERGLLDLDVGLMAA